MYSNGQDYVDLSLVKMPDDLWKRLHNLLRIQSTSKSELQMALYIYEKIRGKYSIETDKFGNIIVTKGKADRMPCIVSHMDTVHDYQTQFKVVYEHKQTAVIAKAVGDKDLRVGVGGDDKCGIFACLVMLEKFKNIKAIFFSREETGLVGSSGIDDKYFNDVGYIIQLDRWGRADFICKNYSGIMTSPEYMQIALPVMQKYGYKQETGLITDSVNLWDREIGVSCVNVSCGYYQHHSNMEFIDLNELYNSLKFTEELITALGENLYPSKPIHSAYYKDDYDDDYFGRNKWGYYEPGKGDYFDISTKTWKKAKHEKEEDIADEAEDKRVDEFCSYYEVIVDYIKDTMTGNGMDIANISKYEEDYLLDELEQVGYMLKRDELKDIIDEIKYGEIEKEYDEGKHDGVIPF